MKLRSKPATGNLLVRVFCPWCKPLSLRLLASSAFLFAQASCIKPQIKGTESNAKSLNVANHDVVLIEEFQPIKGPLEKIDGGREMTIDLADAITRSVGICLKIENTSGPSGYLLPQPVRLDHYSGELGKAGLPDIAKFY